MEGLFPYICFHAFILNLNLNPVPVKYSSTYQCVHVYPHWFVKNMHAKCDECLPGLCAGPKPAEERRLAMYLLK